LTTTGLARIIKVEMVCRVGSFVYLVGDHDGLSAVDPGCLHLAPKWRSADRLTVLDALPLPVDITWIAWSGDNRTLAAASAGQPSVNYLMYLPDGRAIVAETSSGWTEWLLLDSFDGHLIGKMSPQGHIAGSIASPLFAPSDWQHVYWPSAVAFSSLIPTSRRSP
jgi:hypothetical protein